MNHCFVETGESGAKSSYSELECNNIESVSMPMRRMSEGEGKSIVGETESLDEKSNELRLGRAMLNLEICDQQGTVEFSNKGIPANFDGISRDGNGNILPSTSEVSLSGNSIEQDVLVQEMVIVINPERNAGSNVNDREAEVKGSECQPNNVILDKLKTKILQGEKSSHVIDMKCGGGIEGVCRICHLRSEGSLEDDGSSSTAAAMPTGLIQLGCGCKDELGIAHSHCAEAWFKLRGNRICEICEETVKNVSDIVDSKSMQEWTERFTVGVGSPLSERGGGCWRGQPFCNFLMACLVMAFVLVFLLFFRVRWL